MNTEHFSICFLRQLTLLIFLLSLFQHIELLTISLWSTGGSIRDDVIVFEIASVSGICENVLFFVLRSHLVRNVKPFFVESSL